MPDFIKVSVVDISRLMRKLLPQNDGFILPQKVKYVNRKVLYFRYKKNQKEPQLRLLSVWERKKRKKSPNADVLYLPLSFLFLLL